MRAASTNVGARKLLNVGRSHHWIEFAHGKERDQKIGVPENRPAKPSGPKNVKELNDMWDGATQYGTFTRIALQRVVDRLAERGVKISLPLDA